MQCEQNKQAESLLCAAIDFEDAGDRKRFLDRECGDNAELREQVEQLVAAHFDAGDFLQHHNAEETLAFDDLKQIGSRVGQYKLLEKIGEGGMGIVYVALQQHPIRRTVALKLIKPGMDSRQVISRFNAERQALAMMNHSHIAKVLDAGTTESGRPYFVMELVKGIPITDFCDQHRLDLPQRLDLFRKVCEAVQHAHQKGIIHRDLKPTNILVELEDIRGVPKVIDFGIAKATHRALTEHSLQTGLYQMIGTPMYMSPEQAQLISLDVDTRSDIYSLGVLLYELLTGDTPFDCKAFQRAGFDEMRRIIREDEPPRPSARVSTLEQKISSTASDRRQPDVRQLSLALRCELDWIVMKALEKDRSRRYATASDLAADLERYLQGEAVQACPPTLMYRLGKYSRRHKLQLISAGSIAVLLIVATLVSSSLAGWAISEKGTAQANLTLAKTSEALAVRERQRALNSQALAEQQQQLAQQQELLAQQQRDAAEYDAYVANIQLAYSNWARGDTQFKSLAAVTPQPGRPDFRGWEWYFLYSQTQSQQFTLSLQAGPIAWCPSRKKLATADRTGLVDIRDARSGRLEKSLAGCPGNISSLCWSSNGKYFAAGGNHGTVVIWDVASGNVLRVLYLATPVLDVDWNPDSQRLATAGINGNVSVWDSQSGVVLSTFNLDGRPAGSIDWHPEGSLLIKSGGKIWDTRTRSLMFDGGSPVGDASFSPDGKRFVVSSGPANVFDLESKMLVSSFPAVGSHHNAWSPSGQQMASAVLGGSLKLWDVESGIEITTLPGHDTNKAKHIAWNPTDSLLASSSSGIVKVWNTALIGSNPRCLSTPGRSALSVAFSPDGRRLLEGARFGLLKIWDVETGNESLSLRSKGLAWNRAVAYSPDGKRFAAIDGVRGRGVVIHNAETGFALLHCTHIDEDVRSMAWSPNGKILAVGYRKQIFQEMQGRVGLFDNDTGRLIAMSDYSRGQCDDLAWSQDCSQLAAAGGSIRIWDSQLNNEKILTDESTCLDWSPDGQQLVSGSTSGKITIYDAAEGTATWFLQGHRAYVGSVEWHPYMPRIASGSKDGTVRIFDAATGRELCVFTAHGKEVQDVTWSLDGMRLATAGHDGQVRIWDGSAADRYLKRHGDLRDQVSNLVEQQQYQHASEILERLHTLYPDEKELQIQSQRLQWLQAMELAVAGQADEGQAILEKLTLEQANVPDYRLYLPAKLYLAGKHNAAIALAEQLVEEFPEKLQFRNELEFLYQSRVTELCEVGQFAEAIPILKVLAKEFSDSLDFRIELVYVMAKSGRSQETIQMLGELAQAFDQWPDYRPELARRFSTAGEHGLSANIYTRLIADYPDAVEYSIFQKSESAFVALAGKELDKANELLKELKPEDISTELQAALGGANLAIATEYLEHEEFEQAIPGLMIAADMIEDKTKSSVRYWLALAQLAANSMDDYRASCAQMLEQFDGNENVLDAHWMSWTCALAPQATSDFAMPIAAAEFALRSDPKSVSYLTDLGAILYRSGDLDEALTHLTEASALAETAATYSPAYTWYFLAMVYHERGQEPQALEWFSKANARSIEELGTESAPNEDPWNRRQTLKLLHAEAEALLKP